MDLNITCKMNPKNVGIHCLEQTGCEKCGWNPVVAKQRHEETMKKYGIVQDENSNLNTT